MTTFEVDNEAELEEVALQLAQLCNTHLVFILDGPMGAGKTTLIGRICNHLDIEDEVSSPTYGIVNTYFSEKFGEINHFDFYRIESEEEAMDSGLDEQLNAGNICFVEWAEKIPNLLPNNCVRVAIEVIDINRRKITITI